MPRHSEKQHLTERHLVNRHSAEHIIISFDTLQTSKLNVTRAIVILPGVVEKNVAAPLVNMKGNKSLRSLLRSSDLQENCFRLCPGANVLKLFSA